MPHSSDLLFAYGTLMAADSGPTGRTQRARLAREARSLGAAWTEGRLYNLGRFPGLVLPAGEGQIVHGELLELTDPTHSLRWLDAYEGIVSGHHPHNDYQRLQHPVTPADGTPVMAWVYVYRAAVAETALISGGRWLAGEVG